MLAMREAVSIPVTVKCRIGIDELEDYGFFELFVLAVRQAGVDVFVVHARNAILQGLTRRKTADPTAALRRAERLKRSTPSHGDPETAASRRCAGARVLPKFDGVMIGRRSTRALSACRTRRARFSPRLRAAVAKQVVIVCRLRRAHAGGGPSPAAHAAPHPGLFAGLPRPRVRRYLTEHASTGPVRARRCRNSLKCSGTQPDGHPGHAPARQAGATDHTAISKVIRIICPYRAPGFCRVDQHRDGSCRPLRRRRGQHRLYELLGDSQSARA